MKILTILILGFFSATSFAGETLFKSSEVSIELNSNAVFFTVKDDIAKSIYDKLQVSETSNPACGTDCGGIDTKIGDGIMCTKTIRLGVMSSYGSNSYECVQSIKLKK